MSDALVIDGDGGTITVTASVLEQVVIRAAEQADGVRVRRPRRGLDVAVDGGRARVSLELALPYGAVIPAVAGAAQERVAGALAELCGLEAARIDVAVEELAG